MVLKIRKVSLCLTCHLICRILYSERFTYNITWHFHTFAKSASFFYSNTVVALLPQWWDESALSASHVTGQNALNDHCISRTIEPACKSHTSSLNPHKRGIIPPVWVQLVAFSDAITAISHKAGGSLCPSGCVQGPRDTPRRRAQLLMSPVCWSTRWWLDWFSGLRPICYQHLFLLLCFGGRLIYRTVQIALALTFVYGLAWALIYDEEEITFTVATARQMEEDIGRGSVSQRLHCH